MLEGSFSRKKTQSGNHVGTWRMHVSRDGGRRRWTGKGGEGKKLLLDVEAR